MESLHRVKGKLLAEWQHGCLSPRVMLLALAALNLSGCERAAESAAAPWSDVIEVRDAAVLPPQIHAQRIPLGLPNERNPDLVLLPSGELLLAMFQPVGNANGTYREELILYRSRDGGVSWGKRQVLPLLGREPHFSVLRDGTLFLTTRLLATDYRNKQGYDHACVYRSTDSGDSWSSLPILAQDVPGAPPRSQTRTSRNILELQDGSLIMGVSAGSSTDYLWRSFDEGQTWNRSLTTQVQGYDVAIHGRPWYGEMILFQARDAELLGIARAPANAAAPFPDTQIPSVNDDSDRMLLFRSRDGGHNWTLAAQIGDYYGEMYPSLLRLTDGRMLFTFSARGARPPLGLQAVLGVEQASGFSLNFATDRLLLDEVAPAGDGHGGGFGNTVRLPGGQLVTAYSYRGASTVTHAEVVRWVLPYYVTVADAWAH
jgi:BNR repeat-like domain